MAMHKNIKFQRRTVGEENTKLLELEKAAVRDANRRARSIKIDRDEFEARAYLAEKEIEFLQRSAPADLKPKEIANIYNKIVVDGRYIGLFKNHPKAAAELLGEKLSDSAERWITMNNDLLAGGDFKRDIDEVASVGVVAVAVIVVVMEVTAMPTEEFIMDSSGTIKF